MLSLTAPTPKAHKPFGVYIHFPYCLRRCPYCDFNTRTARVIPHEAYLDAVLRELDGRAERFADRTLVSIYFGGGTPGLWRSDCIARVVREIKARWAPRADPLDVALGGGDGVEVTVEFNPRAAPEEDLSAWKAAGVNRLSMGFQSFQPDYLRRLGRDHTVEQAWAALDVCDRLGFDRLSFDLLFGGPGHTAEEFSKDLSAVAQAGSADHISAYSLIVEPDTPFGRQFAKGELGETPEDVVVDMLEQCETGLARAGYTRYEISNYARAGRFARHNSLYWAGAEYMGLGVGAHELSIGASTIQRRAGAKRTEDYLENPLEADFEEVVEPETHLAERLYLGLRTAFGVSVADVECQFSLQAGSLDAHLDPLVRQGLIECVSAGDEAYPSYLVGSGPRYVPTARGMLFSDTIARELL